MKPILVLIAFCCGGDFLQPQVEVSARQERKAELKRISHCCAQEANVELGLQEEVCWECRVREVLELSKHKHTGEDMTVKKFRKKPVVVEAIQLTWENWEAVCDFVPGPPFSRGVYTDGDGKVLPSSSIPPRDTDGDCDHIGLYMSTVNGRVLAKENDWIIKGIAGEFYLCKPDIFEATYEGGK